MTTRKFCYLVCLVAPGLSDCGSRSGLPTISADPLDGEAIDHRADGLVSGRSGSPPADGDGSIASDGDASTEACSAIRCDPPCERCVGGRCEPTADGTSCDDGNPCSEGDACRSGRCVGGNPAVVAIASGAEHTCAVRRDGSVFCWGDNTLAQLGSAARETMSPSPVKVAGLPSNIVAVAAGWAHTCALSREGAAFCWGRGDAGQLGSGTMDFVRRDPVPVVGLGASVAQIEATHYATFARLSDGSVRGWGSTAFGELGTMPRPVQPLPIPIPGLASDVALLSTGWGNTVCARKLDGALWCWGWNMYHQVDPSTPAPSPPLPRPSLGTGVARISTGLDHVCVVKTDATLWCWGGAYNGALGTGQTSDPVSEPVQVETLGSSVADVGAGSSQTCAVSTSGALFCWGSNHEGQLGDGTTERRLSPVEVKTLGAGVTAVSAAVTHTCAIARGAAYCWGRNRTGEVGDGTTVSRRTVPARVKLCFADL